MQLRWIGIATTLYSTLCVASEPPACAACAEAASVDVLYTGEAWRQASGGAALGGRYVDNLDVSARLDGARLVGVEGLQLFAHLYYNGGGAVCEPLVGSAQCVSNIEADEALRLLELWAEWSSSPHSAVRMGLYDLNSEFDSIETAALFINSSHGMGAELAQTGENGPSSFPVTSLGLRAKTTRGPWSLQAAVLDAVPGDADRPKHSAVRLSRREGALLIGELNYGFLSGARAGLGYWRYTADFPDLLAGAPRDDNAGAYLLLETGRWFASSEEQGARAFVRVGQAEARINPIENYFGAGLVYESPTSDGRARSIGIALALAELGNPYRGIQSAEAVELTRREYIWELTYRHELTEWLAVQPDVQYIRHPGMDPDRASSWTIGLRFEVSRSWAR